MIKKVKKIFLPFKVLLFLLATAVVGFAVYEYVLNIPYPQAEYLSPLMLPEWASYPTGTLPVKILMYHNIKSPGRNDLYSVSPSIFEQQMHYLSNNGYTSVSYDDFFRALTSTSTLPEKSVLITFDDGYRNQYDSAFPILKKYGFTATFFPVVKNIGRRGFLNWAMLKEMTNAGMIVGSHSYSHKNMLTLNDKQIDFELQKSKNLLEKNLGVSIKYFCYPYGLYDDPVVAGVKRAGYVSAVSVRVSVAVNKKEGPYFVPRARVGNDLESFVKILR